MQVFISRLSGASALWLERTMKGLMKARFLTCDVFTDRLFGGNQLAVFPDASAIAPELMAPIAKATTLYRAES